MGVVPKDTPFLSNQSCKSLQCPLPIANCKEYRYVVFKFDSLVKGQMNQKFDIFYFSSIVVKYV